MAALIVEKIKLKNLSCASCCLQIEGDLESLDGVKYAKTSFIKSEVEIEYDEHKISKEVLLQKVQSAKI